ncbi:MULTISPECIES: DUF2459 domain-containing protein [Nostoc]|uniref:DUF2459 domain-containing protein n=1 Tax=Nostoc TaxID=1177 RepID=UPI001F54D2CF|nr:MULTISPECIES: DUF2459 domain-containing protein [Nostoc]
MGLYRTAKLASLIITSILLVWMLSPTTIVPPTAPVEAITIYVTDYGWHSRLVLPSRNGILIQYAYGDWNYFALNQQDLINGLAALFLPTQGTLGRRTFSNTAQFEQIMERENASILSLKVGQAHVTRLLKLLDKRFNRHLETRIENSQTGLTFVQDNQDYTLLHNSNHELAAWLQDLDCQIHGLIIWANFRVKTKPKTQSPKPPFASALVSPPDIAATSPGRCDQRFLE